MYPIGGVGDRREGLCEVFDRLVMIGVDPEVVGAHDLDDLGAAIHLDLVRPLPLRYLLAVCDQVGM
jgi:hypothetical protein